MPLAAEKIFLAGPEMQAAADVLAAAGKKGFAYAPDMASWLQAARDLISSREGACLIKASRSMRFEKIIEGLG